MELDGLERYRLIRGHFSLRTDARLADCRYRMTLLRDPIRRIVSKYRFWRLSPEVTPVTSIAKTRSFADFVRFFEDSPAVIRNRYTFHFAGIGRDCPAYPADERGLLAQAQRNLASFDFAGITEQLGESAQVLCRDLGWSCPREIPRENATGSERLLHDIDSRTLDLLRERNRLDLELYEFARELFRQAAAGTRPSVDRRFRPFPMPESPARAASIRQVSATWSGREPVPSLEINVDFETTRELPGLSAGVLVHDAQGRVVWGTSTLAEGHALNATPGRTWRLTFEVDFPVPPGLYSVTAALAELRLLGLHHHWMDRASFFEVAGGGKTVRHPIRLRRISPRS
jgi:hypothetical protein